MLAEEIRLLNLLSVKVVVVVILMRSNICGSKKFDESLSIKLFAGSRFSCFNKSIWNFPGRKIFGASFWEISKIVVIFHF